MQDKLTAKFLRFKTGIPYELIFLAFALSLPFVTYLALTYPPTIVSQGQAHRIFYIHVPIAWVALYAPLISSVCGLMYLFTRQEKYDVWSLVNVRLAFLFGLAVIISGPIWASTEWGTYWNWKDSRLVSFFILLLTLVGYLIVRYLTDDPRNRAVYSSLMAILSAIAALLTWFAIRLINPDTHPTSVLGGMSPKIRATFWISVLGYHLVFLAMLRLDLRHEYLKRLYNRFQANS